MPTKFENKVYEICRKIPKGKVSTYKLISEKLGIRAYRAVGNALNKNPYTHKKVPCHRIVNSNGLIGGFAAGVNNKKRILEKEGIEVKNNKIVNFDKKLFKFK